MLILNRGFFERLGYEVAFELVGSVIVLGERRFRIVELEAYGGFDDPASHASRGKTKRCAPMFEPGGCLYVYLCYGIHRCLNIVTGGRDEASAVLIRSIIREQGFNNLKEEELILGPGRVGKYLSADLSWSGIDLFSEASPFRLEYRKGSVDVSKSKRVGITKGVELEWRFYESKFSGLVAKESR